MKIQDIIYIHVFDPCSKSNNKGSDPLTHMRTFKSTYDPSFINNYVTTFLATKTAMMMVLKDEK